MGMTCIIVGTALVIVVVFLCWLAQREGAKFDRQGRRFRRWLRDNTPKGKDPPNVP
jgi:hypothetical protein